MIGDRLGGLGMVADSLDLADLAMGACKAGVAVVFIEPGGTRPLCTLTPNQRRQQRFQGHPCGIHHAITDPNRARLVGRRLMAEHGPNLNIAVALHASGLILVDADHAEGAAAWERRSGDGPTVRTPGKRNPAGGWVHQNGTHTYYRVPDRMTVPDNLTVTVGEGKAAVDIRTGGYALITPSVRPEGPYVMVGYGTVTDASDDILELIAEHVREQEARRSDNSGGNPHSSIAEWSRNTSWAALLERAGFEPYRTEKCGCPTWSRPGAGDPKSVVGHDSDCPKFENSEGHGPAHFFSTEVGHGLGGRTVTKFGFYAAWWHDGDTTAAAQALGLSVDQSGMTSDWFDGLDDVEGDDVTSDQPDSEPTNSAGRVLVNLPDTFWRTHPRLEHIRADAWSAGTSPDAELGMVLNRIAAAIPPRVQLPPRNGGAGPGGALNVFDVLVGHSGSGKDTADERAAFLLGDVGASIELAPGSGEGLSHLFVQRVEGKVVSRYKSPDQARARLVEMEADTLAAVIGRQNSTLAGGLRTAWSGKALGFNYVDQAKALPVPSRSYRLCLAIGMQPGKADVLLGDEEGGTPQRFTFWPAGSPPSPAGEHPEPGPLDWVMPDLPPFERVTIDRCDAVTAAIKADMRRDTSGPRKAGDINGQAVYRRIKVAALLGVLLNEKWAVDDQCWELAGQIMDMSERVVADIRAQSRRTKRHGAVERGRSDGLALVAADEAATAERIRAALGRVDPAVGESPGDIRKRIRSASRPKLDRTVQVLDALVKAGLARTADGRYYPARK